jgi:hypothetical protein
MAKADNGWHLALEAQTVLPVDVGPRLTAESPWGLRASTSFGVFTPAYLRIINSAVVAADVYGRDKAEVLEHALDPSLVWRLHLGWRPPGAMGLFFAFGYGVVHLTGLITQWDLYVLDLTPLPPARQNLPRYDFSVTTTLHMLNFEVGWEQVFLRHLVVRLAVGLAATVGTSASLEPNFDGVVAERAAVFCDEFEGDLEDTLRKYGFLPTLSVALGYRFF